MKENIYNETEIKSLKLFNGFNFVDSTKDEINKYINRFILKKLEDKYDVIVFNKTCNESELKYFKQISDIVFHDIELTIGDCQSCLEDLVICSEDFNGLYSDEEILNGFSFLEVHEEISRAYEQMEKENNEMFSYRFIKKEFIPSFSKFFMLEENKWFNSHYNDINFKNVLLFDSKYDEEFDKLILHNNENSDNTKTFLSVYCPTKITIIKLF